MLKSVAFGNLGGLLSNSREFDRIYKIDFYKILLKDYFIGKLPDD